MTTTLTPSPTPAPVTAPAAPPRRASRRRPAGIALAAPFALLLLCTVVVPIGYALYLSLFTDRLSGLGFEGYRQVFTGFATYTAVLGDPAFADSVAHVALYAVVHIPVMSPVPWSSLCCWNSPPYGCARSGRWPSSCARGAGGDRRIDLGLPLQPGHRPLNGILPSTALATGACRLAR